MPQLTEDQIKNYEIRQSLRLLNLNVAGKAIDYADIGYDIIIAWGSSNTVGYGAGLDAIANAPHPRVFQYPSIGDSLNTIIPAVDPLFHRDPVASMANRTGYVFTFAKQLAGITPGNRRILILPVAESFQQTVGFASDRWNPGNDLFNDTVTRANLLATGNNRVIAFTNAQHGADSVAFGANEAEWIKRYVDFYREMRALVKTAASAPAFTIGVPDSRRPLDGGIHGTRETTLANLKNSVPLHYYVSGAGLPAEADNIHYSRVAQLQLGYRLFDTYASHLAILDNRNYQRLQ